MSATAARFPRELLEPILHAVAQTLQCNSASLALIDEDQQALVMALGISAPGVGTLPAVERVLGFSVSGLPIPLSLRGSLLVRALHEERLLWTVAVNDVAGGVLPPEMVLALDGIIGPRSFAAAPVLGRTRALAVLLIERVGQRGFSAPERELLLSYCERIGAELESEVLEGAAERLERLGQVTLPPPRLVLATPERGGAQPLLRCIDGAWAGQPLHEVLGLGGPESLFDGTVQAQLLAGESVTLPLMASTPSVVADIRLPKPLRVTLRPTAAVSAGAGPVVIAAIEDLSWSQSLRRETVLARERLLKVMRSIEDAILTLDRNGIVQQANEASHKVLGISPEELCGTAGIDLAATPRARAQLLGLGEQLRQTGFTEVELRLLRLRSAEQRLGAPDGPGADVHADGAASLTAGVAELLERHQASLSAAGKPLPPASARPARFLARLSAMLLCDETGAPAGAVWRIHDQTQDRRDAAERHRLRVRLLQSERLSALGEMAARIAHEVRNPLVSIGAAAQVIAEEMPESSSVRSEALAIGSEVRRLDHILNNVLRFARPARTAAQRTEVAAVARQVLELVRPKAAGLSLRLDVPPGAEGASALIDADQLKQVLWNVLLNACEAARPGEGAAGSPGVIECSVRRRSSLRTDGEGHTVLIAVADSGPGIPPALRRRVFDPFFSTKSRGTGLGLAICKQIIEEAGGRIRLLNRRGGGTRVIIELRSAAA